MVATPLHRCGGFHYKFDHVITMVALLVSSLKTFLSKLRPALWTIVLVLILSSDVEQNPGPVRFPCSVCYKPVCVNQCILLCDVCDYWCHCRCCGVDAPTYISFQNARVFSWTCPKCVADEMPFMTALF